MAATSRRSGRVRRLDPAAALPDALTAHAMDDAACARELIDDLLVLVEAGYVHPIDVSGETRYAAASDCAGAER